jgi:hypothetical protein
LNNSCRGGRLWMAGDFWPIIAGRQAVGKPRAG